MRVVVGVEVGRGVCGCLVRWWFGELEEVMVLRVLVSRMVVVSLSSGL